VYTTRLEHTLSSRNLPMLKGAYKRHVEIQKKIEFCMKKFNGH
jgi:hypothetical protein